MTPPKSNPKQLDLFETGPAPGRSVAPASVAEELKQTAQELPAAIRLGTSSWSFPAWQNLVFLGRWTERRLARDGLHAYARHPLLRAVGIDRTYYAPITAADFARYAQSVRDDFRFLVKAHNACTQPAAQSRRRRTPAGPQRPAAATEPDRFLDADYAARTVVEPLVEGLGPKAGPLLFQFPPLRLKPIGGPQRFIERLHAFLRSLPRGPLYAVELRNDELLTEAYAAMLADLGVCQCLNVHPTVPAIEEQARFLAPDDTRPLVIRWMLHARYNYKAAAARYAPYDRLVDQDPLSRRAIADLCRTAARHGRPAFVIINNKAEGCAPLSVIRLAEQIVAE